MWSKPLEGKGLLMDHDHPKEWDGQRLPDLKSKSFYCNAFTRPMHNSWFYSYAAHYWDWLSLELPKIEKEMIEESIAFQKSDYQIFSIWPSNRTPTSTENALSMQQFSHSSEIDELALEIS